MIKRLSILAVCALCVLSASAQYYTNIVVSPYASYFLDGTSKDRVGYGMFATWNITKNVGLGSAIDYANHEFTLFSGQLVLKVPTRPLTFLGYTNFTATPFAIVGAGSPLAGAGNANGGLSSISGVGASFDFLKVLGVTVGVQGTFAKWTGAGEQTGKHAYLGLLLRWDM